MFVFLSCYLVFLNIHFLLQPSHFDGGQATCFIIHVIAEINAMPIITQAKTSCQIIC